MKYFYPGHSFIADISVDKSCISYVALIFFCYDFTGVLAGVFRSGPPNRGLKCFDYTS